jgi:ribosome biogenesis GTPase / thiamine phosphate phosphatase
MQGVVTKSTGSWYQVYIYKKDIEIDARLKGIFRLSGIRDTNPVTVGDTVTIENEEGDYVIAKIDDRKNYVIRQSPKHKAMRHIIASNIDLAAVVVSISKPRTSTGFIDRFLVTTEAYRVPALLVINKVDDLTNKDEEIFKIWKNTYTEIGYQVLATSTYTGEGIDELKNVISNKRTLFSGHSGVGKSSLLNTIEPSLDLRTNEISGKHDKGMHTTTFSELFRLSSINAEIIDTPGIKEFGVLAMLDYELKDYFKEFIPYLNQCKFDNCMHINEPQCAVDTAIREGKIALSRYQNYLNILENIRDQAKGWELKKR